MSRLEGDRLVQETKVIRYLLNPNHPEGGSKARYLISFGFEPMMPEQLIGALIDHPQSNEIIAIEPSVFGVKSVVKCHIATPDGRNPCITTVWIAEHGSTVQRLVTAYPTA